MPQAVRVSVLFVVFVSFAIPSVSDEGVVHGEFDLETAEVVGEVDSSESASLSLKVRNTSHSEVTVGFLLEGKVYASGVRIPAGKTRSATFLDNIPGESQLSFVTAERQYLPYVTESYVRVEGFAEKRVEIAPGSSFEAGETYTVVVEVGDAVRPLSPITPSLTTSDYFTPNNIEPAPSNGGGIPSNPQIRLPPNNFPFYSREHGFGLESPTKNEYKSYRFLGVTRTFSVPDNPHPNHYGGHDANPARFKPSNVYKFSYNPNDSRWYSNDSKVWSETNAIPHSYDPGTGQWYRYGLGGWKKSATPK